jgi:oligo-1,6-glucosidase/alpha-glucosidase
VIRRIADAVPRVVDDASGRPLPWWTATTVYHIYPRSFADGNGDGIGDIPGILARLDYVRSLGVETIWFSPFYRSPQADFGYDISDHFDVAPEYGSLDDCRRLIDAIHARGMRVVFDMVLNHTSDQHPWFRESRSSRRSPLRDWYIWRDGRRPHGGAPPNNWRSVLGGSGWHHDAATGQWYWASFLPFQPDLNYRNPAVKRAMLDVVRHWLREGVDGLRLDLFNTIYKDASFADNPFSLRPIPTDDNPEGFFQRPHHTMNHPDTVGFARELRAVVDEFDDPPRFLVGEVFGPASVLRRYCGDAAGRGLHLVFLFKTMRTPFRAASFRELIAEFEREFPWPLTPTYVFGNHDRPRVIERLGDARKAKLLATLQLTVRGVPFIYYGDEIGMGHHEGPSHTALDPVAARFRRVPRWVAARLRRRGILLNRDGCRRPMQWDEGPHAGFAPAGAVAWLPGHPDGATVNVAAQDRDPASLLSCYRRLLALRARSAALRAGRLELRDPARHRDAVLGYRRVYASGAAGDEAHVFLNFSERARPLDLSGLTDRALHSNLHDEVRPAPWRYPLAPFEGIVLLAGADVR